MGLFALAAFMAEQRTKEIGIRKVLGASSRQIVWLLTTDFVRLVLLAFLLATPFAWWAMHEWLSEFAFRISLTADLFVLGGLVALLIALLTVSAQAFRAAGTNPVNSLKEE
jgi:putative ABC transport system permease protein